MGGKKKTEKKNLQFHVLSLEESNGLWASINHIGHLEVFPFDWHCGNAAFFHIFGELQQNGCYVFIDGSLPGHFLLGCMENDPSNKLGLFFISQLSG